MLRAGGEQGVAGAVGGAQLGAGVAPGGALGAPVDAVEVDETGARVQEVFYRFLTSFVQEDDQDHHQQQQQQQQQQQDQDLLAPTPFYLQLLDQMVSEESSTLYVNFEHVVMYEQVLAEFIESQYFRFEPFLKRALQQVVSERYPPDVIQVEDGVARIYWLSFHSLTAVHKIRQLLTSRIGALSTISGTVTRTSDVRPELLFGSFTCQSCHHEEHDVAQQFKFTEPLMCKNAMCAGEKNVWQLNIEQSRFVDWQRVRVQENPDEIPSGAMPRSLDVILRHEQVEKAKAGDKCLFTGTLIVVPDVSKYSATLSATLKPSQEAGGGGGAGQGGVRGLKGLGVRELTYKLAFLAVFVQPADGKSGAAAAAARDETDEAVVETFTQEEREEIYQMKQTPDLYSKLVSSIAPRVFGHEEIKRGLLLMLFGGVHKTTLEGISLRGDINVCIVGDPSTAKSQFLKYTQEFLPRAVYTSGKSSSAAGLTATVVKDPDTGEFNIEAGALMLADNGICAIDEFDKMDVKDQVAIHEAMEQQTISIAKAGIQATLNARTSILAAANPVHGRYDRSKTLRQNLAIGAALMSRFDLFFIVLDECDALTDHSIAEHIVHLHQTRGRAERPYFSKEMMQRYIKFARSVKPRMTPDAAELFVDYYRRLRSNDAVGSGKTAYRITVRQLESMIRLAEALARLHLSDEILPRYVDEAARLLRKSIIHVESESVTLDNAADDQPAGATDTRNTTTTTTTTNNDDDDADDDDGDDEDDSILEPTLRPAPSSQPSQMSQSSQQSQPSPGKLPPTNTPSYQLSYEEYTEMSNMIVNYLRRNQKVEDEGMKQQDIIDWYTEQIKGDVETGQQLMQRAQLLRATLQKMLRDDHRLVLVDTAPDGGQGINDDLRILKVHPNFVVQ